MKITLIQTGKTTSGYIMKGVEDFASRIRRYIAFELVTVPDLKNTRNMPPAMQKEKEGKGITRLLNNDDYIIILDESGKTLSTLEFAADLRRIFMMPKKRAVFIIGGPWGIADEVRNESDFVLSLSKMTFSHQLVRLLFAEQLYRALTVINGDPYHHE